MIRIATKSQAGEISRVIPKAAKLTKVLYTDLIPGKTMDEALRADVEKEETKCSYKNCLVAIEENQLVGLANFYPSEEFILTQEMQRRFGKKKCEYIAPIYRSPLPRTLYISALFVAESTRGKGIGKKLIKELCRRAKDSDRNGLSLHCWVENHPAMEFYKRLHFQVKEILDLGPHSKIPYDGRLALLISNNL